MADEGAMMLLSILNTVPEWERMEQAGVSPAGIDFVQRGLVVEPASRPQEAELLAHEWIGRLSLKVDASTLDASQLSLGEAVLPENDFPNSGPKQLSLSEAVLPDNDRDTKRSRLTASVQGIDIFSSFRGQPNSWLNADSLQDNLPSSNLWGSLSFQDRSGSLVRDNGCVATSISGTQGLVDLNMRSSPSAVPKQRQDPTSAIPTEVVNTPDLLNSTWAYASSSFGTPISARPERDKHGTPPIFGELVPTMGSIPSRMIHIVSQATTFGRDPECDYEFGDPTEDRVPKRAMDIALWYPRIEDDLACGKDDWHKHPALTALISTRTSRHIRVNGVKLTRGTGCWLYGKLHTGDVITIFGPANERESALSTNEEANARNQQYLQYKCTFFCGQSQHPRPHDKPFVVDREEEKFRRHAEHQ